jgi:hypothetical protein
MRILRWLLWIGLFGISYRAASHAEWQFEVKDRQGGGFMVLESGPLWTPPPAPSDAQLVNEYRKLHPDRQPHLRVSRTLSDWLPFEWMLVVGVYSGLVGLVYAFMRRGRRDLLLEVPIRSGITLGLFSFADAFLWGLIPYWVGFGLAVLVGTCVAIRGASGRREGVSVPCPHDSTIAQPKRPFTGGG